MTSLPGLPKLRLHERTVKIEKEEDLERKILNTPSNKKVIVEWDANFGVYKYTLPDRAGYENKEETTGEDTCGRVLQSIDNNKPKKTE